MDRRLTGPIVWIRSFVARFALAPWACTFQSQAALFGVALAALVLCSGSALLARHEWKALGEQPSTPEASVPARSASRPVP